MCKSYPELSAGKLRQNCPTTITTSMQPSWMSFTSNNQKIRVDGDTNSDYKTSNFHRLYGAENQTLQELLEYANGNIEMRSSSAMVMMTIVAAATIVPFPPVIHTYIHNGYIHKHYVSINTYPNSKFVYQSNIQLK